MDIDQAIFNNSGYSFDLIRYAYRKKFGLTAEEFENEPADQLFTNNYITAQLEKKREWESRSHGSKR